MVRALAIVLVLMCLAETAWAQNQAAPGTGAASGAAVVKPAAKKQTSRAKTATTPAGAVKKGPCRLGIIPAVGDQFVVQKVGFTIFNNEYTEVPIDAWGLDDIIVARVRAAAGGETATRRLAYAKGTFTPYDHPKPALFRNSRDELTAIVRQIAANAGCERYVAVTKLNGLLGNTNQTLLGVGVLNHGTKLFSRTHLFVNISVTVFDGQTFAIHRNPPVAFGTVLAGALEMTAMRGPHRELDNAQYPASAAGAVNSATLRDGTRALLAETLDKALPAILAP
jgi:hypothetical protein